MADVSTEDLDVVGPPSPSGLSAAAEAAAAAVRDLAGSRERILGELRRVIVGQDEAIDLVLTALFTGGHCLITGVPGLAKTRSSRPSPTSWICRSSGSSSRRT